MSPQSCQLLHPARSPPRLLDVQKGLWTWSKHPPGDDDGRRPARRARFTIGTGPVCTPYVPAPRIVAVTVGVVSPVKPDSTARVLAVARPRGVIRATVLKLTRQR
jgi:hypothetical protein